MDYRSTYYGALIILTVHGDCLPIEVQVGVDFLLDKNVITQWELGKVIE